MTVSSAGVAGPSAPERSRIGRWSIDQPLAIRLPAVVIFRCQRLHRVMTVSVDRQDGGQRKMKQFTIVGHRGYRRVAVVEESDCVEKRVDYQLASDAVPVAGYGARLSSLSHAPHAGARGAVATTEINGTGHRTARLGLGAIPGHSRRDRPLDRQHPEDESRRCGSASCHRPLDPRRSRHDAPHRPNR
jgi:hypothetical protein